MNASSLRSRAPLGLLATSLSLAACNIGDSHDGPRGETGPDDPSMDPYGPDGGPQDPGPTAPGPTDSGPGPTGCTNCGAPTPLLYRLDLTSAVGLAVVTKDDGAAALDPRTQAPFGVRRLEQTEPGMDPGVGETPPDDMSAGTESLWKLDDAGNVLPALEEMSSMSDDPSGPTGGSGGPGVPRVTALGLSPDGSVYVLFEFPFLYKPIDPSMVGPDVWNVGSGYTCQLFRSLASWDLDRAADPAHNVGDLECVTDQHQIATWRADRVLQFDRDGKLYFPARVPNAQQEVFYVYDPATMSLKEKVNGNICWRDVEVTPRGSVFYTGVSSNQTGDCSGTSFFRFVSSDNKLTEIARDWWDFKYLAENDPNAPDSERIIFYGPDPTASGAPSWESACLYRYDPSIADVDARVTRLASCMSDVWSYVYGKNGQVGQQNPALDVRLGYRERCEATGQLFISGEGVSHLSQAKDGTIYAAGNLMKKLAGTYTCDLQATGDHCSNGNPDHDDQTTCEGAGGTWYVASGNCSNGGYANQTDCEGNGATWYPSPHYYPGRSGTACGITDDPTEEDLAKGVVYRPGWTVTSHTCAAPTDGFSSRVDGLAYLEPDPLTNESVLRLLSEEGESVEDFWAIEGSSGTFFYYSVYDHGKYLLRRSYRTDEGVVHETLLEDYEVYNLGRDPVDLDRILFDGLHFATNTYMFGSVNPNLPTPEEVAASLELVEGLTGQVETLIILPDL